MKFIIKIYVLYIVLNYIVSKNSLNNHKNKIIYFDLDLKEDVILKDIYIKKYNSYFNLALDTLGFISGLFISKSSRFDFILGDTFSPMNSYRIFEGNKADLNIYQNENISSFPIVLFKFYKNQKFYYKNKTYDGIIGLALNYTYDILLDECYFFGEDKKYSFMNYLTKEIKILDKNIFSIYKDKFILGNIAESYKNKIYINYCNINDKIEESFIYFFWNCDINSILINNICDCNKRNFKISLMIDSLLKNKLIATSLNIANIIINQINNEFNDSKICYILKNNIYCLIQYYERIKNMNLKLNLNEKANIEIPFDLLVVNKTNNCFNLNIEISEFNIDKHQHILKLGKDLFKLYLVIFDAENRRIGFQKLNELKKINLETKYYYTNFFPYKIKSTLDTNKIKLINSLFFIVILSCFIGIIVLLYGKNNFYYYNLN